MVEGAIVNIFSTVFSVALPGHHTKLFKNAAIFFFEVSYGAQAVGASVIHERDLAHAQTLFSPVSYKNI